MNLLEVALGGAALCTGLALTGNYFVRGRSSQFFGPSFYRGPGRRRSIALTFDDGPSPGTQLLLAYLASNSIRATFFQCGANVLRHPQIAREVHRGGHEIANHTFSHPRLPPRLGWQTNLRRPSAVFREFARTQEAIGSMVGVQPTLLRPPYGLRWFGLRAAYRELGLREVMWTVIGRDWELPSVAITDLVLRHASAGGIICLHDGRETQPNPDISQTLDAVRLIVPALRDRGYTFETVSDLLQPDNPSSMAPAV